MLLDDNGIVGFTVSSKESNKYRKDVGHRNKSEHRLVGVPHIPFLVLLVHGMIKIMERRRLYLSVVRVIWLARRVAPAYVSLPASDRASSRRRRERR